MRRRSPRFRPSFPSILVGIALLGTLLNVGVHLTALPEPAKEPKSPCLHIRSIDDLRRCYSPSLVRLRNPSCHHLSDWKSLKDCVTFGSPNITQIHILGERHSGTKFVMRELQQCLPNHRVHRDWVRSKHFFQPIVGGDFSKSMIVVIVRDPFDWMAALAEQPYHSPQHVAGFGESQVVPLSWQDFVRRPWTMPRTSQYDTQLLREHRTEETRKPDGACRERFEFHQVVPCRTDRDVVPEAFFRGYEPIYEMQRDGRPYANALELRTDKLLNFALELPLIVPFGGFVVVRYEDLLQEGTAPLLQQITDLLGISEATTCQPTPPQPERLRTRHIPPEFRKWISQHMDHRVEALFNYNSN